MPYNQSPPELQPCFPVFLCPFSISSPHILSLTTGPTCIINSEQIRWHPDPLHPISWALRCTTSSSSYPFFLPTSYHVMYTFALLRPFMPFPSIFYLVSCPSNRYKDKHKINYLLHEDCRLQIAYCIFFQANVICQHCIPCLPTIQITGVLNVFPASRQG